MEHLKEVIPRDALVRAWGCVTRKGILIGSKTNEQEIALPRCLPTRAVATPCESVDGHTLFTVEWPARFPITSIELSGVKAWLVSSFLYAMQYRYKYLTR